MELATKISIISLNLVPLHRKSIMMSFDQVISNLADRLKGPLPGKPAQLRMSSLARLQELIKVEPTRNVRHSSVLILLYPCDAETRFVLMLRPRYPGVHSGQISLPGGKYEPTDQDLAETALRESKEEIGVDPLQIQLLGKLTNLFIPPSNFMVTPFVGYQSERPVFKPDPCEVAQIIEVTLSDFMDNSIIREKKMKLALGLSMKVPAYCIGEHVIWGATAMILSEFREIIEEILMRESLIRETE